MVAVVAIKELLALVFGDVGIHVLLHSIKCFAYIRPAVSSWVKVRPQDRKLLPSDLTVADDVIELVALQDTVSVLVMVTEALTNGGIVVRLGHEDELV